MPASEDNQPKPDPKEQQAIFASEYKSKLQFIVNSEYKSKQPFIAQVAPPAPLPPIPEPPQIPTPPPASDE